MIKKIKEFIEDYDFYENFNYLFWYEIPLFAVVILVAAAIVAF
tara:strand:+ start:8816 stop:8944 length:129 start_codon:yes stop_codon:yes gene_type:complete